MQVTLHAHTFALQRYKKILDYANFFRFLACKMCTNFRFLCIFCHFVSRLLHNSQKYCTFAEKFFLKKNI